MKNQNSVSLVLQLHPYAERIDTWIEKEFAGYGVVGDWAKSVVDGTTGPCMTMADAKQLTRVAVLSFLLMKEAQ